MSLRAAVAGGAFVAMGLPVGAGLAVAALAAPLGTATPWGVAPSAQAVARIPAVYLRAYRAAAATCPGLSWTVLAGIGAVETGQGRDDHVSPAGARGPMQFEPATFARYDRPIPPGGANPPSPDDPVDAIYAAARDLCANGARDGADLPAAVYAYNHDRGYVAEVLAEAGAYAAPAGATSPAASTAVSYALAQIGTPYRWGGETPGVGFDCSGLTQAAYAAAGVAIPRTSEAQWSTLPHVPLSQIQPGDLVFFNPGEFLPGLPGHVGIYIGHDDMVDAPHSGATVRVESLADGPAPLGAARPADLTAIGAGPAPLPAGAGG